VVSFAPRRRRGLPESFGGNRSWDYHRLHVWLQDASLAVLLLEHLWISRQGASSTSAAGCSRAVAGDPGARQIMLEAVR
jgi:hypothetical protein